MSSKLITIGVFFDGTGNNGYNVEDILGPSEEKKCIFTQKESYNQSVTNIFRLYNNYKFTSKKKDNQFAIYISGIGTEEFHQDSIVIKALGVNRKSVRYRKSLDEKIEKATKLIFSDIVYFLKYSAKTTDEPQDELIVELNLFGFSRGAALARIFANKIQGGDILENYKKSLGILFKDRRNLDIKLKLNFIGLYDTVESIISLRDEHHNLNLDNIYANHVFQISALHECRINFPLTSILTKDTKLDLEKIYDESFKEKRADGQNSFIFEQKNKVNTTMKEIYVPGAHSDIGGGALNNTIEGFVGYENNRKYIDNNSLWKDFGLSVYKYCLFRKNIIATKKSGHLQLVYLNIMAEYAKKNSDVDFDLDKLKEVHNFSNIISEEGTKSFPYMVKLRQKVGLFKMKYYDAEKLSEISGDNPLFGLYSFINKKLFSQDFDNTTFNIDYDLLSKIFIHISANNKFFGIGEAEQKITLGLNQEVEEVPFIHFFSIHSIIPNKPTKNWLRKTIISKK